MKLVSTLRFVLVVAVILLLGLGLLHVGISHEQAEGQQAMYRYYSEHFLSDIGAPNAVASILLTYRMYDTIFEAIILLCSIIGIMHFLPAKRKKPAAAAEGVPHGAA